uniref:Vps52 C-terminal domain-containing protein n=1 Tax=Lygus hesperus TaxID=30085 RepID=A0A0A9WBS4_LYGHE
MDNNKVSEGFGGLFALAEGETTYMYYLPLLSDTKVASSYLAFRLGERGGIFRQSRISLHRLLPIIPFVERAHGRRHSYEETFRSMLYLLTDMITHEYLFTMQFFAGDNSIHTTVLKPVI